MEGLKKEIQNIKERNALVEAEKAWETSIVRTISVTVLTYIVIAILMLVLQIQKPFMNALIPTVGYVLSFQSLPFLKKLWVRHYVKNN